MPEGHSVHRIARQFARHFVGAPVAVSSPQGRFAADAALLDGHRIVQARAVGKQMFLEFDNDLWLRVHLGLYGAWDFAGDVGIADLRSDGVGLAGTESSLSSIGAPRLTRLRMSEQETPGAPLDSFPPEPIGQVRVRLLTDSAVADLRGPTACAVETPEQVQAVIDRLGPDPLVDDLAAGEQRFVDIVRKKPTAIALLLMDQSVISGIGNVYRAEMLFRARQNPFTPGREVRDEVVRALWRDWVHLLGIGFDTGRMYTMDDESSGDPKPEHWVYKRTGEPCLVCGTPIQMQELGGRKLYWCPVDQA
jgi:formamidopyrimidine-DNA glycosylase